VSGCDSLFRLPSARHGGNITSTRRAKVVSDYDGEPRSRIWEKETNRAIGQSRYWHHIVVATGLEK
jgi:hypothetical protein